MLDWGSLFAGAFVLLMLEALVCCFVCVSINTRDD